MTNPSAKSLSITTAILDWDQDGIPVSSQFGDIYFSKQNGLAETRYVFLEKNNLSKRLNQLAQTPFPRLCIGETGFGTGLNFLSAWQLRDEIVPECRLHFVSVEKYPLSRDDLIKALSFWPELNIYAERLISDYPALTAGWHHVSFYDHRVELNLFLGDALEGYSDYQGTIDAWFLDGFAPAKNPPMWSNTLFMELARLSHEGTSFSTFTAASAVREGLKKAGFEVNRTRGFGRKRHMLTGVLPVSAQPHETQLNTRQVAAPWFAINKNRQSDIGNAVVIGGGLAGTSAAVSLARRGWQVVLCEGNQQLGNEASGNEQGILYNKLSAEPSISSDFYTAGYLYSQRQFTQLQTNHEKFWHACGVLQLGYNAEEERRQARFMAGNPQPRSMVVPVNSQQASKIAGITLTTGGLFFPSGGWAAPNVICKQQASHANIELKLGVQIAQIRRDNDAWLLFDDHEQLVASTKVLIVANAHGANRFEVIQELPLKAIRGQTTNIPANPNISLNTVLCGKGYIGPAIAGRHHMGATFNLDCAEKECRTIDHQTNLTQLAELAPSLAADLNLSALSDRDISGRVGFRCTTPDYLPLVGPVPDRSAFLSDYASLRKNALFQTTVRGTYLPGLYLSVGHGSKGLTSCPLAGELIAAYINQEPFPISTQLTHALNPGRFLIRSLKRNKI